MKRLIKYLVILITLISFSSCDIEAFDETKCLQNVKEIFPNSKIYKSPKFSYSFYVIYNNDLYLVKTTNLYNHDISSIEKFYHIK